MTTTACHSIESSRVGFRQIDVKDGRILVNGNPVIFRGVNRHDHHDEFGKYVPYEYGGGDRL